MFIRVVNEATAFQRPASLPCAPGVLDWNSGDHLDGFPGAKGAPNQGDRLLTLCRAQHTFTSLLAPG